MKRILFPALLLVVALLLIGCGNQQGESSSQHSSDMDHQTDAQMTSSDGGMAAIGQPAPDFTLLDSRGTKHSLSDFSGKYVILEWINYDCPFVKKHYNSRNMQALQTKYTDAGVVWLGVCSSAPGKQGYFEGDVLKNRLEIEEFNGTAYLIDSTGTVGKMYDAKTTPHMYVIDPDGVLRYMGAIDDKPSTDANDIPESNNYVVMAMESLMAGEKVETTSTKSYGCSVKYP